MLEMYKTAVMGQFEASLAMMQWCLVRCPDKDWEAPVARYPFWMVAYHALCYVDCYLSASDAAFETRPDLHPRGRAELEDERPSRRFEREELVRYCGLCLEKLRATIPAESSESLGRESGFHWLPFTRAELHLYNLRHVQHHVGQLTALLRRCGAETGWVKSGWKEPPAANGA